MDVSALTWAITVGVLVAVLVFDVIYMVRNPHEPSIRECAIAIGIYIGAAILFGIGVWVNAGHDYGVQFFAGWLTEYSLSIDNLFIFLLIMAAMGVPRQYQQFALLVGIIIAIVLRAIFIFVGAAIIERFSPIFFLFGAFLIYTAIKLAKDYFDDDAEEETENWFIRRVRRTVPTTEDFRGTRLWIVENGKRFITPMMLVILALGSTDLMFALDSIPAIYGLTQEPYLVFTANIFALMGLRQLYFLLGGLLKRLVYLSLGLAVILGFIGVKLLLHAVHEQGWDQQLLGVSLEIDTLVSLAVIIVVLVVTTVASLVKSRSMTDAELDEAAH